MKYFSKDSQVFMATHVPFTDNYDDLSTDRGFQFRFNCERCGNGHMSAFQANAIGMAGGALQAAGSMFGGILGRAAHSAYDIQRMVGGPAHDNALRKAVEEVSPEFTQCRRCGNWVCREVCWNESRGQCVNCAPHMDEEIKAIESDATIHAIREKAYEAGLGAGVNVQSAAAPTMCPQCGAENAPGQKFCGECGTNVLAIPKCPSCGAQGERGQKFCGECGSKF
jgi:rubrerythrin